MDKAEQAYWSARTNECDTARGRGITDPEEIQNFIYEGVIANAQFYADEFGVSVDELLKYHR
jgi:hypothetical protein